MALDNDVTLLGKLLTDPQVYTFEAKYGRRGDTVEDPPRTHTIVNARVYSQHWVRKGHVDALRIWAKWDGALGEQMLKMEVKQGDHVYIRGHLGLQKTKRHGSMICLHVARWSLLWPPPNRFLKGHVLMPQADFARFQAMEEQLGPFDVVATDPIEPARDW